MVTPEIHRYVSYFSWFLVPTVPGLAGRRRVATSVAAYELAAAGKGGHELVMNRSSPSAHGLISPHVRRSALQSAAAPRGGGAPQSSGPPQRATLLTTVVAPIICGVSAAPCLSLGMPFTKAVHSILKRPEHSCGYDQGWQSSGRSPSLAPIRR